MRHRLLTLLVAIQLIISAIVPAVVIPVSAQTSCNQEVEPNDTPEAALAFTGAGCYTGSLPDIDQDIWLWTVPPEDSAVRWTFTVSGIAGTVSGLKLLPISSEPGVTPITAGIQLLEVAAQPDSTHPIVAPNILIPAGTYILGMSRSGRADGLTPPDVNYTFSIAAGDPMPANGDAEPNDDAATANPVSGAFELSGENGETNDLYAWSLSDDDANRGWHLFAQVSVGTSLTVELIDANGVSLQSYYANAIGIVDVGDIKLQSGVTTIQIWSSATSQNPYVLKTSSEDPPANDFEPNDTAAAASRIDLREPVVKGRLDHETDRDTYRFTIDDTMASTLFDAKLIWKSQRTRQLCLEDAAESTLQCRSAARGVSLSNILLPAGDYFIVVSGDADPNDPYLLRFDITSSPSGEFESEPNDTVAFATTMSFGQIMQGRLDGTEDDYIRLLITGEPQLWELDVVGAGLDKVSVVNADGNELLLAEITPERTSARISDVFLAPGEHWFRIAGVNGTYALSLTPLGPPDLNAEREANNDSVHAELLAIDQVRSGRLVEATDTDVYRFSLAAREHISIDVKPPVDGAISVWLQTGYTTISSVRAPAIDQQILLDEILEPGDYEIWLAPTTTSTSTYELTLQRLDPYLLAEDQEPNNSAAQAQPLPASFSVHGFAGNDDDWFALPVIDSTSSVTITTKDVLGLGLSDGVADLVLNPSADGTSFTSERLPAGVPLYVRVTALGDYEFEIQFSDGPAARVAKTAPPVSLTLTASTDRVAAYWNEGQRIDAVLKITAKGIRSQTVKLEAVTTHYGWSVELSQTEVKLNIGATIEIPVTIRSLPDAWADVPVRITVKAQTATGDVATAFVEITPDRDGEPVNPEQAWAIPDALRGGFDVAALALGATVAGTVDAAQEAQLHDGLTPAGNGFYLSSPVLPLELTVDLAGDDLVPVAGIVLNPQGADAGISDVMRGFDFLVSEDGVNFTVALSGEISPLPIDQAFVLPEPVNARYARLRILSTYNDPASVVVLGEWKVIAQPGFALAVEPFNLAEWSLGGHVVTMSPQSEDQNFPIAMMTGDGIPQTLSVAAGTDPSWVIGFNHDRAAEITELQWIDPPGSNPNARFNRVKVEVSLFSPVGPWESVATWKIKRADDGAVKPLTFDHPIWARFIRIVGDGPAEDSDGWEYPDAIRVFESPSGTGRLSILGEWGQNSFAGPYEFLNPAPGLAAGAAADSNDTAERAEPLHAGTVKTGRVHIGENEDWYVVTMPESGNTLSFTVTGERTVGVSLTLFDLAGAEIPMTHGAVGGEIPAVLYTATVKPGAEYKLRVQQPPHSVVMTFDTSASLGNYEPFVLQSMRSFASSVTPGQEFINIIPFDDDPLLENWTDQPYEAQSAVGSYVDRSLSSSAETAIIDSNKLLADQEGAKAILIVTDAETSSYPRTMEMWGSLQSVRPIVFTVHVAGNTTPLLSQHMMEDWATVAGGYYQYTRSHAEMDRAFDRLATWLRRPVTYQLSYEASTQEAIPSTPEPTPTPESTATPEPQPTATSGKRGSLRVIAGSQGSAGGTISAGANVGVEIILDTSGSMLAELEAGSTRIDVAKSVLTNLVTEILPEGAPVALRVFGSEPDSCETTLLSPLQPLDGADLAGQIANLVVINLVKTPIGFALEQVANDLAGVDGPKVVVLVTDGEETCGGDPAAAIRSLMDQGIDVQINIVGFALDDEALKTTFKQWARLGNGSYFDATNAEELDTAIAKAASAPFRVYDQDGNLVASGTVGGTSVQLDPGTYTVVVLTDPNIWFQDVVIEPGKKLKLDIDS